MNQFSVQLLNENLLNIYNLGQFNIVLTEQKQIC